MFTLLPGIILSVLQRFTNLIHVCSWILNAPLSDLNAEQKVLRYFIRCTNLYGRLAHGRNQLSLKNVIQNQNLCLTYENIMKIVQEDTIPYLVRARFFSLLERLYVDRDPQTSTPSIVSTRVWSKCIPEKSDLDMDKKAEAAQIPICTNNFQDLLAFLLKAMPALADCKDEEGRPSLNGEPRFGQLEMIKAMISLCSTLIDFGFWQDEGLSGPGVSPTSLPTESKTTVTKNHPNFVTLMKALFAILETREKTDPTDAGMLALHLLCVPTLMSAYLLECS